jgi:hypothetical protein
VPFTLFRWVSSESGQDVAQKIAVSPDSTAASEQQGAVPSASTQRISDADPGSLFAAEEQRRAEVDLHNLMSKPTQQSTADTPATPQVTERFRCESCSTI